MYMGNINWNELRDRVYKNALNHGFHEKPHEEEHYLMLVITELSEAVNADRKDRRADIDAYLKDMERVNEVSKIYRDDTDIYRMTRPEQIFIRHIKDTVEDELADATIRLLDFAGAFDYSIDETYFKEEAYADSSECLKGHSFIKIIYTVVKSLMDDEINISFVLFVLLSIAWHYKIDLLWHIEQKMKYNEMRPYKHGKKY